MQKTPFGSPTSLSCPRTRCAQPHFRYWSIIGLGSSLVESGVRTGALMVDSAPEAVGRDGGTDAGSIHLQVGWHGYAGIQGGSASTYMPVVLIAVNKSYLVLLASPDLTYLQIRRSTSPLDPHVYVT